MAQYPSGISSTPNLILVVFVNIVLPLVLSVLFLARWSTYRKAGYLGIEAFIPFYNLYVRYALIYGSGWRCLYLFVPLYGLYVALKARMDFAKAFGLSRDFGIVAIICLSCFYCVTGFGRNVRYIGTQRDV